MKRRNYTPNDNRNVIRMLAVSFAGSAKGRNRILFMTVVLSIITLTMVFGISRGKIRSEELSMIRENGTAASGVVESGTASQYAALKSLDYIKQTADVLPWERRRLQKRIPVLRVKRPRSVQSDGQIRMHGRICFVQPIQRFGEVILKKSLRSCFPKRR